MKLIHSQLLNIFLLLLLGLMNYYLNNQIDKAYSHYPEISKESYDEGYKVGYEKGTMRAYKDGLMACLSKDKE